MAETKTIDVLVRWMVGSNIFAVRPLTDEAKKWIDDNAQVESWQWLGDALHVDKHHIDHLTEGMVEAGLVVA